MSMLKLLGLLIGVTLAAATPAQPAPAEGSDSSSSLWQEIGNTMSPPDFGVLNARRKRLETEILELMKKREAAVIRREKVEADLRRLGSDLAAAEQRERAIEAYLRGLGSSAGRFGPDRKGAEADLADQKQKKDKIKADLTAAQQDQPKALTEEASIETLLTTRRNQLDETERRIADVLNVDANKLRWRTVVALLFCALLAYLIFRFFQTSDADEKVRQGVFSEHAGIQFITLFCLVIAIVLFGIIGVLEGKELSALLGGLSGYILGRANGRQPAQPTPPRPAP